VQGVPSSGSFQLACVAVGVGDDEGVEDDVGLGLGVHPGGGLFCDQINRLSELPGTTLLGLIHFIS